MRLRVMFDGHLKEHYRFVAFGFRPSPKDWEWGDKSLRTGVVVVYRMFCFGPVTVRWG